MKRAVKYAVIIIALAFAFLQFFQIEKTNPPVDAAETLGAAVSVPPEVAIILARSCNDCHSNLTVYPWYSYIQPVGWWMQDHFLKGRDELNFSTFGRLSNKQRSRKFEQICDEITEGKMPLPSYTWGHPNAVLSDSEKQAVCSWTQRARAELSNGGD